MFLTCSRPPFPPLLLTVAVSQDPGPRFICSSHQHFREAPHDRESLSPFPPWSQQGCQLLLHQSILSLAPFLGASVKGLNGTGKVILMGFSLRNRSSLLSSSDPLHFKIPSKFPGSHCFCQGVPNPSSTEQKGNVGEDKPALSKDALGIMSMSVAICSHICGLILCLPKAGMPFSFCCYRS